VLTARGRRLGGPTEDVGEVGRDFLVGKDGRILYAAFRSKGPAGLPSVPDRVTAVRSGTARRESG
jgi:hypothetical protein